MSTLEDLVLADQAKAFREVVDEVFKREYLNRQYQEPDYYAKRRYGKYTIYNKEGWRVAWGLNEKEMKNYMKLLKKEE
jgi:hypothetical protein